MSDDRPLDQDLVKRRRRRLNFRLPLVSGVTSAIVLVLCFGVTALLIPFAVRQKPWIDAEIVCAAWWLIWIVGLSILLYTGHRISDDYRPGQPRNWFTWLGDRAEDMPGATHFSSGCWWFPIDALTGGEGCLAILVVIVALLVILSAAWFLIEIAFPVVGFAVYFLVRGMVGAVVNDRHGCEKSLPRAIGWGTLWATLYTAPLALLVFLVHLLTGRVHN
jgi:hypothetical protein